MLRVIIYAISVFVSYVAGFFTAALVGAAKDSDEKMLYRSNKEKDTEKK